MALYVIKWHPLPNEVDPNPLPKFEGPFPDAQAALDWAEDEVHLAEGVGFWDFLAYEVAKTTEADLNWLYSLLRERVTKQTVQALPFKDVTRRANVRARSMGLPVPIWAEGVE